MFEFEDPVGVQLMQDADGRLTGRGCAAGAPGVPAFDAFPGDFGYCGSVSGEVSGRSASFAFTLEILPQLRYSARVTVSDDARRMAGEFTNGFPDFSLSTAWLRVADDADWIKRSSTDFIRDSAPLVGAYELTLIAEESTGSHFVPRRSYAFRYSRDGLGGDLGSFWNSEMSRVAAGSPQHVGPVPATAPALPTSLDLDFDGGGIRRVTATMASGDRYTFAATKVQ